MYQDQYDTDERIMALATPWGESALAIIRTAGKGCLQALAPCLTQGSRLLGDPVEGVKVKGGLFSLLIDPKTGESVDEVVLTVFRAPSGYTGQDSVELTCHGSLPGIQRILQILRELGFRDAQPGEFTLRAFLKGKLDLTQAEAVQEIIGSRSATAHALALNRLTGGLHRRILTIQDRILDMMSQVEVQLDYAEDEFGTEEGTLLPLAQLEESLAEIESLLATYRSGRLFRDGAKIVITGKTNAGKSSLFNMFLKYDRAIVSDIHGTTRDFIESWITIDGLPVRLYDTAGLRESSDAIEEEGIRRSRLVAESADIIMEVIDGSAPDALLLARESVGASAEPDQQQPGKTPRVVVWNKVDVCQDRASIPAGVIPVSAATGEGLGELETAIIASLRIDNPTLLRGAGADMGVMIDSARQRDCLEQAREALLHTIRGVGERVPLDVLAAEVGQALEALGMLTGEMTSEDILDRIFSSFCVGK